MCIAVPRSRGSGHLSIIKWVVQAGWRNLSPGSEQNSGGYFHRFLPHILCFAPDTPVGSLRAGVCKLLAYRGKHRACGVWSGAVLLSADGNFG